MASSVASVGKGSPPTSAVHIRRREWLSVLSRAVRTRRGTVGFILMGFVVAVAVVGPFISRTSPTAFVVAPFSGPAPGDPLGGDALGRDVLARVLAGGWLLLLMAAAATLFGIVIGGAAGISAAYLRGRADTLIMRSVDVLLAFPSLVLALMLVSIIGPKVWLIVLAVGLSHAPQVARVLRASTLDISERDFVKAVELQGVKPRVIMAQEILPNLITPLTVEAGLRLTYSIIIIAGLSFLGFGQPPPAPNWGLMINENRIGMQLNPWAVLAPAALIALLTVGTNTFSDAVARVALGVERRREDVKPLEGHVLVAPR
jgi:peptide/nickel transport system permease protein